MSDVHLLQDRGRFMSIAVFKHILNNDLENLKDLIDDDKNVVNFVHKKSGDTPMLVAARHRRFETLKLLYEHGADIKHKNLDGKRTLHEAAYSGCTQCVEYLLQRLVETCGKSTIDVDVLKRADWTPLMMASSQGHLDVVKTLVRYGANVTRINKDGWNSFHLACREGYVSVIEFLMDVDSSVWKTCSNNLRTPLHTSSMHGQHNVVEYLLEHCSYTIDEKDSCGSTPLMDALRFGFVEIADTLINKQGADVYECDSLGRSCIHVAAHSGQIESVKYLMEKHMIDINAPCSNSSTSAIHLAAKEGHLPVVELVVSAGASISTVDKNNRTALHLSTACNQVDVMRFLLHRGIDSTILDCAGKTALQYALTDDAKLCYIAMK